MASEHGKKGAAAAAAAMDALDAQDASAEAPERADAMARYRELPAVTAEALAEHVRGGPRIVDGQTHQTWEWTNADVARCVRAVFSDAFPHLPARRELGDDQGFDAEGNRVAAASGGERGDAVVARADARFTDILRNLDGTRRYGTGRGLETAEIQLLRTRYDRLQVDEAERARSTDAQRRFDRRVGLYCVVLVLIVAAVAAGFAIDLLSS